MTCSMLITAPKAGGRMASRAINQASFGRSSALLAQMPMSAGMGALRAHATRNHALQKFTTELASKLPTIRCYSSTSNKTTGGKNNGTKEKENDEKDLAQKASGTSTGPKSDPAPAYKDSDRPPAYNWEDEANFNIEKFNELPFADFGVNQHMLINEEFKEVLRRVCWQFRAPILYAFAYGSGVFPQSKGGTTATAAEVKAVHANAPTAVQKAQDGSPKMIDFIFGVTHTQHWHSINMKEHPDHYSALAKLGSGAVSAVQDRWGAGVYFNTHVTVSGLLIKYGVVSIDTLTRDLREWDTLYLAGRLHKPVKILRDHPQVRMANQINLLGSIRTALLMLPAEFNERELYSTIAGISYLGDLRMAFPTENPKKVANIVEHNLQNFRRLYAPLLMSLPNVEFTDPACANEDWIGKEDKVMPIKQDMNPIKRGNMVRRLPKSFRSKLYFEYQKKYQIPQLEFDQMIKENENEDRHAFKPQQGGRFEQRIAQEPAEELRKIVRQVIKNTISWTSTSQTLKGPLTAGLRKTFMYLREKFAKYRQGKDQGA